MLKKHIKTTCHKRRKPDADKCYLKDQELIYHFHVIRANKILKRSKFYRKS